ncbi:integrase core domain-containing protein [Pseudoruminococcus massiliensis]|uniref:integrase core domain-containing protein n=1 Tax=Pseudoruminococcus massiliensis TaxID=2086583 RepID=UPI003AB28D21
MLVNIILYLLQLCHQLYQQNCWLIHFICRYIPLKQWSFDDSHSPKYQKFKIDKLPVIKTFIKQDWLFLLEYYQWKYGKPVKPVQRRNGKSIPGDTTCPLCGAPHHYIYDNNGGNGQYQCKICGQTFCSGEVVTTPFRLTCPHCGNTLVPKKDRKFFRIHKCVNPKCPYYLHNLKKVDQKDLAEDYGKNKYKLHYIYREFTVDFFAMDLTSLPKNASSLRFSKHNAHVMSLCLTLHINLGLSLRKTSQALKDLYNIRISHQQIANYCKTAAICIKPFVDQYPYEKGDILTADETYIKIRGIKTYVWLIMNAATRSILGYQVSDNRGVGPCILAMRMAFHGLSKLTKNFKFVADGYSAYPLAAMEFAKKFGKDFSFTVTQVLGLTNDDAVSKEYRPFKQMIERLNRTYKASYRSTNGFDNIDGANYDLALWVAYYNFLRPHKHAGYKVLNEVETLQGADNMPGKWQLLIFLGQQTILNMQKNSTAAPERNCCQ